jgi:hypothetical protein
MGSPPLVGIDSIAHTIGYVLKKVLSFLEKILFLAVESDKMWKEGFWLPLTLDKVRNAV